MFLTDLGRGRERGSSSSIEKVSRTIIRPVALLLFVVFLVIPVLHRALAAESICNRGDIFICDDFATITQDSTAGGWYDWNDVSKIPQVDTTVGLTDSRSIRLDLAAASVPINPDNGTGAISTGTIRHQIPNISTGQTLYCRWYAKWSNNFQFLPGGSGAKHFYIWAYAGNGGPTHGDWQHRFRFSYRNPTGCCSGPFSNPNIARLQWDVSDNELGENIAQTNLTAGPWYAIELYIKVNTVNVNDGEVKWWINDVLQGSYTGVNVRGVNGDGYTKDATVPFNAVSFDGYFGGIETNVHPAQSIYYDNIVCSSNKVGLAGSSNVSPSVATGLTAQ